MAEDSELSVVGGIEDVLNELLPAMVKRLNVGVDVLDAGCGSGRALIKLAGLFPLSRFTGYDLCADAVAAAQATADAAGLHNVTFAARDLSEWNESASFDLITSFDAIHDTRDPAGLLRAIARALRPGGVHLMQDIGGSAKLENNLDFPFASFLYSISCAHCTPVSLAQGGAGLGAMWGWETALEMLNSAGFAQVSRHTFPHDPMNIWFVNHKDSMHMWFASHKGEAK
jgi:2-polyprenyl-3-methyl-5-hydroxy-6-metoxy-1,4-benzoquinol methylase